MAGVRLRAGHLYGFAPTACRVQGGASFFDAFAVGTPIKIVDGNPALTEIVTPTNVTINNNTCAISIAPANHHNLPYYLTSATGGLQEALTANYANPGINTVILDNKFYGSVGASNVAASFFGNWVSPLWVSLILRRRPISGMRGMDRSTSRPRPAKKYHQFSVAPVLLSQRAETTRVSR